MHGSSSLQELELADEEARVYKLIGPTLIRQDPVEAKANVQKRLEFITGELERLDGQLKAHEGKADKRQQQACSSLFPMLVVATPKMGHESPKDLTSAMHACGYSGADRACLSCSACCCADASHPERGAATAAGYTSLRCVAVDASAALCRECPRPRMHT